MLKTVCYKVATRIIDDKSFEKEGEISFKPAAYPTEEALISRIKKDHAEIFSLSGVLFSPSDIFVHISPLTIK